MTQTFFVDTSFWCALWNTRDQFHKRASSFLSAFKSRPLLLYSSDYVVCETVTLIRYRAGHELAVRFWESLRSKTVFLAQVTRPIQEESWEIFKKYGDHEFSFTDCTTFALMKSIGIKDALTFDDDFRIMNLHLFPGPGG